MSTTAPAGPRHVIARRPARDRALAWAWFRRALSVTVVAAAVIVGVQLGLDGPAVSPVQPSIIAGADTVGSGAGAAPNQQVRPAPAGGGPARADGRGRH
jgi:hypothetical protein